MNCSDTGWLSIRRGVGSLAIGRLMLPLVALALITPGVFAADPSADAKAKESAEAKTAAPEEVQLETTDGLQLAATYYASNVGKEAVPIIMLHGWRGSRADFDPLARLMQDRGYAVIVPDLRGHGDSTQFKGADTRPIEQATMKKDDFRLMVTQDMEAVKKFLMEKNNAGELNIEKLCVVGYEMGAVVAVNWTAWDWHWQDLPTVKQGKDVKALVLISPTMNFKGMGISDALNLPIFKTDANPGLSVLILVGDRNAKADEAKRINQRLGAQRAKPYADPKEALDKQMLYLYPIQGASLDKAETLKDAAILPIVDQVVAQFVDLRLVKKKFAWTNRKAALGN